MSWPTKKTDEVVHSAQPQTETQPESFFKPIAEIEITKGLKAALWGPPETGKSYTAQTFPEPIYVVDTELAAAKIAYEHFSNRDINICEVLVVDPTSPDDKPDPVKSLTNMEQAIISLKHIKKGTIVIDAITDYWSWMGAYVELKAKRFYKKSGAIMRTEWGIANERYKYFIMRLLAMPVNVVLTAQAKRPYDKGGKELPTWVPKWQYQTPHWCDVVVNMIKQDVSPTQINYVGMITKCRYKRAYNAMIEDITYNKLVAKLSEIGVKVKFKPVDNVIPPVEIPTG